MQNLHNDNKSGLQMTGALLVGGDSRRMGQDKALLEHRGHPLWRQGLRVLAEVCDDLLIAGERPDLDDGDIPCIADTWPGSALAGLHSALEHATSGWVTVLPCDLPYPSSRLLRTLHAACRDGVDAVVPRTRLGREPLVACYHRRILPLVSERLQNNRPKIVELLDKINVRYLEEQDLPNGWRRALRNLNSPEDHQLLLRPPAAVSFVARSGTGKTTLLEKVIARLTAEGWRIGALKHDAHRFDIDHEGKDSWRLTRAGAAVTAISSPAKTAVILQHDNEPTLDELLQQFRFEVDLVLTEGFRQSALPKIEVHRAELERPLLSRDERHDPTLVAVASNGRPEVDVPLFELDDVTGLCRFIEERYLP